jgi:hypothetical protein
MRVYQLFLPLELDRSFDIFFQFFPIVKVTNQLLNEKQRIEIIDIANLQESSRSDETIPPHEFEPRLEVKYQLINGQSIYQKLSKRNNLPITI